VPPFEEHEKRKALITRLRRVDARHEAPRNVLEFSSNLAWRMSHYTERMERWRNEYERNGTLPRDKDLSQMKRTLNETETLGDVAAQQTLDGLVRKIDWFLDRIEFRKASPHLDRGIIRTTMGNPAFM